MVRTNKEGNEVLRKNYGTGRKCLARNCKNYTGIGGKKFHRIPRDVKLAKLWLVRINRKDLLLEVEQSIKAQRCVCNDHFSKSAYLKMGRVLKKDAIPTMHPKDDLEESNDVNTNSNAIQKRALKKLQYNAIQKSNIKEKTGNRQYDTQNLIQVLPASTPIPIIARDKKVCVKSNGRKCLVRGCKNYTKLKEKKFHRLPNDLKLAQIWLCRIERTDLLMQVPESIKAQRVICSAHFSKSSYEKMGRYLKKSALPSLNPAEDDLEELNNVNTNLQDVCSENGTTSNKRASHKKPPDQINSNKFMSCSEKCLVRDCNKCISQGYKSYKLPKDVTMATCWLEAIKRMDLITEISELINAQVSICIDHFPPSSFLNKHKYLKKTAAPSLDPADFIKRKHTDINSHPDDMPQEGNERTQFNSELLPPISKSAGKSVYTCIAFNCNRKKIDGMKYHSLPKNKNLAKKWLISLNRTDLLPKTSWLTKARKRVCGLHFPPTCYVTDKHLKKGAVPSLLPVCQLKVDNLIQSNKVDVKFDLYDLSLRESQQTAERIQFDIDLLAQIESEGNCIPFNVAKQHIVWGLNYFNTTKFNKPKIFDAMSTFCPVLHAMHDISLLEVLHNLFLINECGCRQLIIAYDFKRTKLITALFCEILDFSINILSNVDKVEDCLRDNMQLNAPYCSMFVFESADIENVIHCIVSIFQDPIIPWRVKCVYVQKNCYSEVYIRLKEKLCPLQHKTKSDKNSSQLSKPIMKRINAQYLYDAITPTTCVTCDKERYFDTDLNLSSTIILKKFDSIDEALIQSRTEKGGLGSVWCGNISHAYNFAQKLKYNTVWINCLGMLNSSVPFQLRDGMNCLGSDFAFISFFVSFFPTDGRISTEFKKTPLYDLMENGQKVDHSFRFQYKMTKGKKKNLWPGMASTLIYGQSRLQFDELIDLSDDYWRCIYEIVIKSKVKTIILPLPGRDYENIVVAI